MKRVHSVCGLTLSRIKGVSLYLVSKRPDKQFLKLFLPSHRLDETLFADTNLALQASRVISTVAKFNMCLEEMLLALAALEDKVENCFSLYK